MYIDDRLEFCDATAAAGTGVSQIIGDVVNLVGTTQDIGNGDQMYLVIQVTTAYASAGTSIEFQLRSSTLEALTGGTTTTHLSSGALATGSGIAAGTTYIYALPWATYQKFMGLWMVTDGAVASGAINAFLTHDPSKWVATPDGI
jgi:hypothetical protein